MIKDTASGGEDGPELSVGEAIAKDWGWDVEEDDTGAWIRFKADENLAAVPELSGQEVTPVKWDWRILWAWIGWVAVGLGLEIFTAFDGSDVTPPLTWVLLRYVPELVTVGGASWLLYHFATEYWKKGSK